MEGQKDKNLEKEGQLKEQGEGDSDKDIDREMDRGTWTEARAWTDEKEQECRKTDGYNFTPFRNQFPYIQESFCIGVHKILPIYMGKPEYQLAWGYTLLAQIYRRDFAWGMQKLSYICNVWIDIM